MSNNDEPLFEDGDTEQTATVPAPPISDRIRGLVSSQPYAVLCVQGESQPYGALVAVAFSENLGQVVFATPRTTRKFRLLSECNRVALVIDNRPDSTRNLMEVEAVTATGRSKMLKRNGDFERWSEMLIKRHPHLHTFVKAPSCALFLVDVFRYFHVVRFQEVNQWIPTGP